MSQNRFQPRRLAALLRAVDKIQWNVAADVSRRIISQKKLAPTHVGGYVPLDLVNRPEQGGKATRLKPVLAHDGTFSASGRSCLVIRHVYEF